jgi:hypothetical protein
MYPEDYLNANFSGKLFIVLSIGALESRQFIFYFEFYYFQWIILKLRWSITTLKGKRTIAYMPQVFISVTLILAFPSSLKDAQFIDIKLFFNLNTIDQNL